MDDVDLIAGTSGGGILALLLAKGFDPMTCCEMYKELGGKVFRTTLFRMFNPFRSFYPSHKKEQVLKKYFGELKLKELKKKVMVTSVELLGHRENEESYRILRGKLQKRIF